MIMDSLIVGSFLFVVFLVIPGSWRTLEKCMRCFFMHYMAWLNCFSSERSLSRNKHLFRCQLEDLFTLFEKVLWFDLSDAV